MFDLISKKRKQKQMEEFIENFSNFKHNTLQGTTLFRHLSTRNDPNRPVANRVGTTAYSPYMYRMSSHF